MIVIVVSMALGACGGVEGKVAPLIERITSSGVASLAEGETIAVDLDKVGTVYEFIADGQPFDYSRIELLGRSVGVQGMDEWLLGVGDSVGVDLLPFHEPRLTFHLSGSAADMMDLNNSVDKSASGSSSSLRAHVSVWAYHCTAFLCECWGINDCNYMFLSGVCGDLAVCIDAKCYCIR